MQELLETFSSIPPGLLWALIAFQVAVLAAQIWAVVDLYKREQVLWDRKWVWLLAILFLNSGLGVLLYALFGRVRAAVEVEPENGGGDRMSAVESAIDSLYPDER